MKLSDPYKIAYQALSASRLRFFLTVLGIVIGVAADLDGLVSTADELVPKVVVTDIRMPPTFTHEGIRAALEIRAARPGTAILVLSQHVDEDGAVELMGAGAEGVGYLLKQVS